MKKMKWHFSPPAAPHFGRCWERLIKAPKEETFMTFLTEAEFVLNNRLLTFVSLDPNDPPMAPRILERILPICGLRPNHICEVSR
jgi:hypothetical protein